MMQNVLIVKTAATGDVVRTTVLLRVLTGTIYWLTAPLNTCLFPDDLRNLNIVSIENIPSDFHHIEFDLVINLEESVVLAQLVSKLKCKKIIGVYWQKSVLQYSEDSAPW